MSNIYLPKGSSRVNTEERSSRDAYIHPSKKSAFRTERKETKIVTIDKGKN